MASFYVAADALIERNGKYLMVEEGKDHVHGKWNIPGGGVEHGEDPVEAAKREVKEETGLEVEIEELINVFEGEDDKDGHPVVVFVFRASAETEDPEPVLDQEVLDAEFKSEEEINGLQLRNDIVKKAIETGAENGLDTERFGEFDHP